jgi:MFS family permease
MASLTHKKLANFYHNWFFVVAAISILAFGMIEFMIVSIPDFPYAHNGHPAWEIQLWSESSGWWSEVTWIILFVVFTFFLLVIGMLSSEIREYPDLDYFRKWFFRFWMLGFAFMSFNYMGYYWWARGGWNLTHAWFYLLTTWLGFYLMAEVFIYVEKLHKTLMRLKWRLS